MRLLVLCTGNSARSQMAEGLIRAFGKREVEVFSAGTHPSRVNPLAIEAMNEIGIDISAHRSKSVAEFLSSKFDAVITVCDNARDSCPVFPGTRALLHWSLADPAAADGTKEEKLEAFCNTRDDLSARIKAFLLSVATPAGTNSSQARRSNIGKG